MIWRVFALIALGCSSGGESPDAGPDADGPTDGWRVVLEDLPGVVLSIWGTAVDDLFVVGGTLPHPTTGDPGESLILHHDGKVWRQMDVSAPTLWWVFGFGPEDVWAVGERGTVLHFDGEVWAEVEGGETYTLWGVWGATPNDLWVVGGSVDGSVPALIRRYDGSAWLDVDTGLTVGIARYFKVWGAAADDVFAVGENGAIVHYDGEGFTLMTSGTTERLITVYGRGANDVWVVGGLGTGVVLNYDGLTWSSVGPEGFGGLMGLWTAPDSEVVVAGFSGAIAQGEPGAWNPVFGLTSDCLHGVWGDGQGTVLAGGGEFLGSPPRAGVIVGVGKDGAIAKGPVMK